MTVLSMEWLLEEWRRKGIEVIVVGGDKLKITGDSDQDIDNVAPLIKKHKKEILTYLIDENIDQPGEARLADRPTDHIPSVCESCPRLELVGRGEEVMAGCLYELPSTLFRSGWRRLPVGATGCMWVDELDNLQQI